MTQYITSEDGGDGFGSQLLSRIAGIIYAYHHNLSYVNYPINTILLEDKPNQSRTSELQNANHLLNGIMMNLGVKNINELDSSIQISRYNRLSFYYELLSNLDGYFTEEILQKFQSSYTLEPPDYYLNGKTNIAIHIRRGNDIREDDPGRYVKSEVYDKIIELILTKIADPIIHIFSWNDPKINIQSDKIIYHTESDGGKQFLSDFNALVHADILLVGSSTFSFSAGIFNKNKVLACSEIIKNFENAPYPPIWKLNFENIIGEYNI